MLKNKTGGDTRRSGLEQRTFQKGDHVIVGPNTRSLAGADRNAAPWEGVIAEVSERQRARSKFFTIYMVEPASGGPARPVMDYRLTPARSRPDSKPS